MQIQIADKIPVLSAERYRECMIRPDNTELNENADNSLPVNFLGRYYLGTQAVVARWRMITSGTSMYVKERFAGKNCSCGEAS